MKDLETQLTELLPIPRHKRNNRNMYPCSIEGCQNEAIHHSGKCSDHRMIICAKPECRAKFKTYRVGARYCAKCSGVMSKRNYGRWS